MSRIASAVLGIVALCAVFVSPASAQKAIQLSVGMMGGVNFGKVSQDPAGTDATFQYKTGWLAGAFLGIQVNDMFSVEPEALYSSKGTKVKGTGSNSSSEGSVKINYIEVPVLGKFTFPISGSQVKPFVFAGPEAEFKVSCTAEGAAFGLAVPTDCSHTDITLKSTSYGVTGGAGVEGMWSGHIVRIDGRYTYGLTNINKESTGDKSKVKLRTFAITAGLGVPLPR